MAPESRDLPLFPLPLVLLPTEVVPLHIFEERYREMVALCLDEQREFGIVWLSDDGLKEVGCTASVAEVLEQMEDGRMNILVRGGTPFRLLERQEHHAYPAGTVELLGDERPGRAGGGGPARRARATPTCSRASPRSGPRTPRWRSCPPTRWRPRSTSSRR